MRSRELINNGKATFYIGFDCTADSLTAGHFMALTLMKRLQQAGNRPIALIGGGTAMIGDPSGRTDMRKMLTKEDIDHNAECFKRQMERFIEFGEGKAMMLEQRRLAAEPELHRAAARGRPHFSVNNMLRPNATSSAWRKACPSSSSTTLIMQSYDFYHLFQNYGCNMEFGGDDQWSNMLGGTELIRRKLGKDAYAMTITLLTDSQGKKMGKTAGNAVWLDPNKTSPFEFSPVLAQRRRRGRSQVHPYADLPAVGADRRDGPLGGRAAEQGQGDSGLRADEDGPRRGGGREGAGCRPRPLQRCRRS